MTMRGGWWSIAFGLLICVATRCDITRETEIHLIPSGYTGWVRIEYGVPGAPPLPTEQGKRIIRVPESGYLQSSTQFEEGWGLDQFFYVNLGGKREPLAIGDHEKDIGRIWAIGIASEQIGDVQGPTYSYFFVGSEEEFLRRANESPPKSP